MLDTLTKPIVELPTKHELIERELLADPERSDREIARITGVDHKTVGAHRAKMGDLLAVNSIPLSPNLFPIRKIDSPLLASENLSTDDFDWKKLDPGDVVLVEQKETAIYRNDAGSVVIRQYAYPDEDPVVIVAQANVDAFLEKLCEVCGVGSAGRG